MSSRASNAIRALKDQDIISSKESLKKNISFVIKNDEKEFYRRRILRITNVTGSVLTIEPLDLKERVEQVMSDVKIEKAEVDGHIGYLHLHEANDAIIIMSSHQTMSIGSETYSLSYATPDAMLFFGNLPTSYETEDLYKLACPFGTVSRCLIIHSKLSAKSKGYGFVEYTLRSNAVQAKLHLGAKYLEGRSLRVDWSDERMREYEDTHASTLFVDRLPRHFLQDSVLISMFQKYGKVNFCQIATSSSTGLSRGFAFVDMGCATDAELALNACNNATIDGTNVRVSYAMPGRPGSSILHPKRPDTVNNLLAAFGMTQLPLLNFAQLLAAHGAPLLPAQLTALMSALKSISNENSSTNATLSSPVPFVNNKDNSSDEYYYSHYTYQNTQQPIFLTMQQRRDSCKDKDTSSLDPDPSAGCNVLGCEADYPIVYQPDTKYYSSCLIQQADSYSNEDTTTQTKQDDSTDLKSDLEWYEYPSRCNINTETVTTTTDSNEINIGEFTEATCDADNSESNDLNFEDNYEPSLDSLIHSYSAKPPDNTTQDKNELVSKCSLTSVEHNTSDKRTSRHNLAIDTWASYFSLREAGTPFFCPTYEMQSPLYSIWGQHAQGLPNSEIFKRLRIANYRE